MKFGIVFANTGPFALPGAALEFAAAAEECGIDTLWTVEHVVVPATFDSAYPYDPSGEMPGPKDALIPDPLIWLSFVAAATSRIELGTGILIVPQRNPLVLAKECATLDHLAGGRLRLGIGVGWLEEEFDALGIPFRERGRRTDDHVAAMRALWSEEQASHHGEFTSFTDCISRPQPPNGTIPIIVGGHSEIAAKRAGRLGDGFFPGKGTHDELAASFALVRETALAHGRDPDAIEMIAGGRGAVGSGAVDEVKALADIGVDQVVVPSFLFWDQPADALARFADDVISKVR